MILRISVLILTGAGAYLLLKGIPVRMPALLRACLAVLLLVGGLGWWASGKRGNTAPLVKGGRKATWQDFLAAGMGVLALECGFLWFLSVTPDPLEDAALAIEAKFSPEAAAARKDSGAGKKVSGNWLWSDERRRELPARTNLKPGAKPEVFIRLAEEGDAGRLLGRQVYVRAFVLDRFQDGVWSIGGAAEEDLLAGEDGWISLGENPEEGILHEVFLGTGGGGREVLTALQGVSAVRLPRLEGGREGTWFLPKSEAAAGQDYLASSRPISLEDLKGKTVRSVGVPRESDSRFGRLAKEAAGEGVLLEKLLNIQDFLRDHYGYSLVTKNPKNLAPLENFLFGEKRGHCEFFATAAALMVRELGVRSRMAYGWAGGRYFKEGRTFVFRAREAHSWVEVELDGFGWVAMEPTPPTFSGGGGSPRIAAKGEEMPDPVAAAAAEEEALSEVTGSKWVAGVALGSAGSCGLIAGVLLFLRRKTSEKSFIGAGETPGRRSGYFAAWQRAAARRVGSRAGMMTLGQQLDSLEVRPAFAGELQAYHYGIRYEGKPPDAECERRLLAEIEGWE